MFLFVAAVQFTEIGMKKKDKGFFSVNSEKLGILLVENSLLVGSPQMRSISGHR